MKIKYAIKNALANKYLVEANESDKRFNPQRAFAFHVCNALYEIALFDSKEDAIKAYEQSNSNQYNETGVIVEMILHE